jgi:hypothetical protein
MCSAPGRHGLTPSPIVPDGRNPHTRRAGADSRIRRGSRRKTPLPPAQYLIVTSSVDG